MKPELKDIIQDPAAGTGGFLIAANHYLRSHTKPDSWTEAQQKKYHTSTFYAQGVKTNVLFFTRGKQDKGATREVWVYDLRANMPQYGKRTQLVREHFAEFEEFFGSDPLGDNSQHRHSREGGNPETARFRAYTRDQIAARGDSLDIAWLKDDSDTSADELPEPSILAQEAMTELEAALDELRGILEELGEEESV